MTRKHAVYNFSQTDTDFTKVAVPKTPFLCEAGSHSDNVYHSCAYESLNGGMAFLMTKGIQPAHFLHNTKNIHTNKEREMMLFCFHFGNKERNLER